jgi:hypothetical protein
MRGIPGGFGGRPERRRGGGARRLVPAAALAVVLVLAACGDNGSSPGRASPEPADMAMVASDLALVTGLELQQVTVAGLISSAAPGPGSGLAPAAVDTLLRDLVTCPLVLHHGDAVPSYYEFRYGAGCVSGFDGRSTSGSIQFTVDTDPPFGPFDIFSEFNALVRDGRRADGSVEVRGALLVPWTLEASGLSVSGRRANAFFSAELDLAPAADPCDGGAPLCGGWRVTEGVGSVTTSLYVYNISVQDTLSLSGCFPHFVRGVIAVTSAGTYPAFIDFGDGTCDDIVTMTVEGRTQTLVLGYGS